VVKEEIGIEEVSNNSHVASFVPTRERGISAKLRGVPSEIVRQLSTLSRDEVDVKSWVINNNGSVGSDLGVTTVGDIGAVGRGDEPSSQPRRVSSDNANDDSKDQELIHF